MSIYFFAKLAKIVQTEPVGTSKIFPFALFSALAFYANYTSIFLVPFYCISVILMKVNGLKVKALVQSLVLYAAFIIPGIIQFLINLEASSNINRYYYPKEAIIPTMIHLGHILFFRFSKFFSAIFLTALLLAAFVITWHKKFEPHYRAVTLSIIISFIGLLFVNYNLTFVYLERSFWYLYLQFIIFLQFSYEFIAKTSSRLLKNLLLILTILLVIGSHNQITASYLPIPGDISGEYSYYTLFDLMSEEKSEKVVVIDTNENYHPLQNYYGKKGKFTHPHPHSKKIDSFQQKKIDYIYSYSDLDKYCINIKSLDRFTVILFDWSPSKLEEYSNCILEKATSIIYLRGVGTDKVTFIEL